MPSRFSRLKFGVAALAAGALAGPLAAQPAAAGVVDPQIFIQQSGTSPAGGTAIGGETNLITNTSGFVVGVAGSFTLQNPLLVVVASISGTPSISFGTTASEPLATVGTYGLTANTGTLTASSSGTAFSQLGLSAGGSESFTNFVSADSLNGFGSPTGYSLYAFAVPTSVTSSGPITIDESGAANGSLILAYSCVAGTGSSSGCATSGDIGQTVNTNTGLLDAKPTPPVLPEPSSLASMGFGLAALGLFLGWRRRRV